MVSGIPEIRLRFWMACPEAPFTRLSRTQMTMARPLSLSGKTEMWTWLDPRTYRVWGMMPSPRTVTKGSESYRVCRHPAPGQDLAFGGDQRGLLLNIRAGCFLVWALVGFAMEAALFP